MSVVEPGKSCNPPLGRVPCSLIADIDRSRRGINFRGGLGDVDVIVPRLLRGRWATVPVDVASHEQLVLVLQLVQRTIGILRC